jgi:membrane protein DedA with SNARE-associated domain
MIHINKKLITGMIWAFFSLAVSGYLASPVLLYATGDTSLLSTVLVISLVASIIAWFLIKQKQTMEAQNEDIRSLQ